MRGKPSSQSNGTKFTSFLTHLVPLACQDAVNRHLLVMSHGAMQHVFQSWVEWWIYANFARGVTLKSSRSKLCWISYTHITKLVHTKSLMGPPIMKQVSGLWLFHMVPCVGLQSVIVVFTDHTHLYLY